MFGIVMRIFVFNLSEKARHGGEQVPVFEGFSEYRLVSIAVPQALLAVAGRENEWYAQREEPVGDRIAFAAVQASVAASKTCRSILAKA